VPTYQYACTECGHTFEQFQSFSDDALTECPECTGRLRKLFNAVGVVFKGSGFYRTDSRTDSSPEKVGATKAADGGGAKSEGGAKSDGGSSSPAKTKDSAPAASTS
jgi:putative FmdB family regulatory protein